MEGEKKQASLPQLWIGYAAAGVLLALEGCALFLYSRGAISDEQFFAPLDIPYIALGIGVFVYWLVCVYKIHKVLQQATDGTYPITAKRAVGFHFLPLYNLYWLFKWPAEAIKFINVNAPAVKMKPYVPGTALLIGFLLGRLDPAIEAGIIFLALRPLVRNITKATQEAAA